MKTFYFTFGCGQPHENHYARIEAEDSGAARREMFRRFGSRWSMMYDTPNDAGVDEYGLIEVGKPVYIGPAYNCVMNRNWKWPKAAHLFTNVRENLPALHNLAAQIGLKHSWFQNHHTMPHYDLTVSKRIEAIRWNATAVDQRREVEILRSWRTNNAAEQDTESSTRDSDQSEG